MIKTIFFDIGGVLIDISFRRTSKFISDCIDVPVSKIERLFLPQSTIGMKKV